MSIRISDMAGWGRDLHIYSNTNNLLILHGQVHDLVRFPREENGQTAWTQSDLQPFLCRYLIEQKYDIVGYFGPAQRLKAMNEDMSRAIETSAGREPPSLDVPRGSPLHAFYLDVLQVCRRLECQDQSSAFVLTMGSRIVTGADNVDAWAHHVFTLIQRATLAACARRESRKNLLIILVEKPNDLPPYLYLGNPAAKTIEINPPDSVARKAFLESLLGEPDKSLGGHGHEPSFVDEFVNNSSGLSFREVEGVLSLAARTPEVFSDEEPGTARHAKALIDCYKYGTAENPWKDIKDRLFIAEESIRTRVIGQELAAGRVMDAIKTAWVGLVAGESDRPVRPKGVLFFAGPTGVGKTEMAKALAEVLLGDGSKILRYDMTEYNSPHADQRLLGAPPGYIGYAEGGKLARDMRANPYNLLLFDEIEKAHESIFDKFMQILDDGRLTDGQGQTTYFSDSIIVFTSNLGMGPSQEQSNAGEWTGSPSLKATYEEKWSAMIDAKMEDSAFRRELIQHRIRWFFKHKLGRPELLNRIGDSIVVFDFIKPELAARILSKLRKLLDQSLWDKHQLTIELESDAEAVLETRCQRDIAEDGGRGIRNQMESCLVRPLNRAIFDLQPTKGSRLAVSNIVQCDPPTPYPFTLEIEVKQ